MADQRPGRTASGERDALVAHLRFQRESFLRNLEGLDDEQARWSPVPSGTSLLWLLRHLGFAESVWVLDRFARLDVDPDLLGNRLLPGDGIESLRARYATVAAMVDDVVAGSELDARCAVEDDQDDPDLRWVVAHLIGETARHAGHADILRELIDGRTGR